MVVVSFPNFGLGHFALLRRFVFKVLFGVRSVGPEVSDELGVMCVVGQHTQASAEEALQKVPFRDLRPSLLCQRKKEIKVNRRGAVLKLDIYLYVCTYVI
jgi:hypothetical protein